MPWQVQSNPTGNPLALGRVTQRRVKPVCFKEKISLKHLRPGLNAGGPVQLPFRITFGLCQVIYVLAVYKNISCRISWFNGIILHLYM